MTGFLKSTTGSVFSTSSISLSSDVSGILPLAKGGTGTSTVGANLLLIGNSSGTGWMEIATSSLGIVSGGGSGTVNSGLLGQAAFYGADGSTLSGTSTLFFNNGNIGVGTTTPNSLFTVAGTSTVDGGPLILGDASGNPTSGSLQINNTGSTKGYTLSNGTWYTTPIAYFKPTDTNSSLAFDLTSNGGEEDTWEDICSSDVAATNGFDWECLDLKKTAGGFGSISMTAAGNTTGLDVIRPLILQGYGGSVGIGTTSSPTYTLQVTGSVSATTLTVNTTSNANNVQVGSAFTGSSLLSPVMTSDTTPSPYVVSASQELGGYPASAAFDNNLGTDWLTSTSPTGTIEIDMSSATSINYYTIAPSHLTTAASPENWTFQGSNDNSAWSTLDTESGVTNWVASVPEIFKLGSTYSYRYYRLNVTQNDGYPVLGISEFTFGLLPNPLAKLNIKTDNTTDKGIIVEATTSQTADLQEWQNSSGANLSVVTSAGYVGIGTSTPTAPLQITTSASNATTSVEIGKAGQSKGSCLVMYDNTGAVQYVSIVNGAFAISSTSCR